MGDEHSREHLFALTESLRPLHKALLDETKVEYERDSGPIGNPAALLQLLTGAPFFAWLRPLSGYMADLDELLDEPEPLAPSRAAGMRARLEALLIDPAGGFAPRYLEMLQRSAEVVIAHAVMRAALSRV